MKVDVKVAYLAMFEFLTSRYEVAESDELAALLGGMSLLEDNVTADPAIWNDWLNCIEKAKKEEVNVFLQLDKDSEFWEPSLNNRQD